jgi:hypothetical protein
MSTQTYVMQILAAEHRRDPLVVRRGFGLVG